jgi:hypothetical protein
MKSIIELAREAGIDVDTAWGVAETAIERFAHLVRAQALEQVPDLDPVISWLENGCNPQDAAIELRLYAAAIRALKEKT